MPVRLSRVHPRGSFEQLADGAPDDRNAICTLLKSQAVAEK